MRLPICYSAIEDDDTFKETFLNMASGTKMPIGYLKSNLEIIEIHVGDTEYLTLERVLEEIKELENSPYILVYWFHL